MRQTRFWKLNCKFSTSKNYLVHIIKSDTKKVSSLHSTSAFTIVLVFCLFQLRTRTNTTWIFSFFSHSTLPLPVTSSLVGAAASYLLPHWKRNVQKTRREIAFVLSFTDFWFYHDASRSGKSTGRVIVTRLFRVNQIYPSFWSILLTYLILKSLSEAGDEGYT